MARDIPTFTSDRVTQIPSMGIVQQSGTRAVAEGLQSRGQMFDQIGEWANRKANEFMERNQRLAAEQAVREGGLNPKDLSSPITAADRIYREAALNTYSIQVQDDIDKNINRLYSESQYDPAGFQTKAGAYLKGTMAGLPAEMKNGVSKYALADIRTKAFRLDQEYKAKLRAEAELAEKAYQDDLVTKIVNNYNNPEERETLEGLLKASIMTSTSSLTAEAKQAQVADVMERLVWEVQLKKNVTGEDDPETSIKLLKEAGYPVTAQTIQQLYNTYDVQNTYAARRADEQEKIQRDFRQNYYSQSLQSILQAKELNHGGAVEEDMAVGQMRDQIVKNMISMNFPADEIGKFKKSANDLFLGTQNDAPEIVSLVDAAIFDRDQSAYALLEAHHGNGLSTATYTQLKQRADKRFSDPLRDNAQWNMLEARYLRRLYPGAFYPPEQVEKYKNNPSRLAEIDSNIINFESLKNDIIQQMAEEGANSTQILKTLEDTLTKQLSEIEQKPINRHDIKAPPEKQAEIYDYISRPQIKLPIGYGGGSTTVYSIESMPPRVELEPTEKRIVGEFLEEPWTPINAEKKMQTLIQLYINARRDYDEGRIPQMPEKKENLLLLIDQFGLGDKYKTVVDRIYE